MHWKVVQNLKEILESELLQSGASGWLTAFPPLFFSRSMLVLQCCNLTSYCLVNI